MRVDIQHAEVQKGLVFKKTKYQVILKIELTEVEKKIIKQHDLNGIVLFEGLKSSSKTDYRVRPLWARNFLGKDPTSTQLFDTDYEAEGFELDVKNGLKQLKELIEDRGGAQLKSSSFEL
jgi:hypothetical protein